MKFVVAEIQRSVDRLEGLEVDVDFLLLALVRHDCAAVDDQAVWGHLGVELEAVLHGSDGAQHREPVHSTFDIGRSAVLIGQHLADATDLKMEPTSLRLLDSICPFVAKTCREAL